MVPLAAVACWLGSDFMTDASSLVADFSAMTTELVQQVTTGDTITVSQQAVLRMGSQQTVSRTGSQHTGSYTGSQQTGSQQTGSQQAVLRW